MTIVQISKIQYIIFAIFVFINYSCSNDSFGRMGSIADESPHTITTLINSDPFNEIKINPDRFNEIYFDTFELDFNNDGLLDKAYSHKFIMGDSLYIFKNLNGDLKLSLSTINFSQDGLYVVDSIGAVSDSVMGNLVIYSYFNGAGGSKYNYFLKYTEDDIDPWRVSYTQFEYTECNSDKDCFIKKCQIKQNVILNSSTDWNLLRSVDEAEEKECVILTLH